MPTRERQSAQSPEGVFDGSVSRLFLLTNYLLLEQHYVVTYLQDGLVISSPDRAMKVLSSREFNQDVSQAKRSARLEPVFVTDRGRPTHVLMSIEAYRRLIGQTETIVDLLAMPALPSLDLDAARASETWER